MREAARWSWFLGLSALVWLLGLARGWATSLAGDPQGVYFVVAQGLHAGDGLSAFASLWYGAGRMPGLPLAITLTAFLTDDLTRAAQIVNIGLALVGLGLVLDSARVLRRTRGPAAVAFVLVATHAVFVSSALEALPDMAAMTATLLVLRLLFVAPGHTLPPSRALAAGLAAGFGFLFRFNALALVVATPLAAAWAATPGARRRAFFAALLGCILMALPIAVIALGLARHGIAYPNVYITPENISATERVGPWVAVASALRGLSALPLRFAWVLGTPVALVGVPALCVLALRSPPWRPPLLVLLAMLGLIAPLHFEARYYLFLLPPAVLGFVFTLSAALERIGPPWAPTAGLVAGGLLLGALNVRESLALAEHAGTFARELRGFCEAIGAPTPRGATAIVGVDPAIYRYTHLRHCPTARVEPSHLLASPAGPRDVGPGFYVLAAEAPSLEGLPTTAASAGLRAHRLEPGPTEAPELREGPRDLGTWSLELPRRPGRACEQKRVTLQPGEDILELSGGSTPPLVTEVEVAVDDRRQVFRGAGPSHLLGRVEVGTSTAVALSLCAGDPLRAKGQVWVELRAGSK